MKQSIILLVVASLSLATSSCAHDGLDDVYSIMSARAERDGQNVSLRGVLKINNGYYNLFSKDQQECVGLLLTNNQRERFKELAGQQVAVTGTFEAEGCGRDGICVEHICGPAILTNVTVSPSV